MIFSDLLGLSIAIVAFVLALLVLLWWYRRALRQLAASQTEAVVAQLPAYSTDRASLRLGQAGVVLLGAGLAAGINALRDEHIVAQTAADALNYARQAADLWFWATTYAGVGIALVMAALLPVLLLRLRR